MQQSQPQQRPVNVQQNQAAAAAHHGQDNKFDNLNKVKQLMWPLRETLANAMKVAGASVYQNASVDYGIKYNEQNVPRFEQSLEEFYAVCDQIEINLKGIQDGHIQSKNSQMYTPMTVAVTSTEPSHNQDVVTYSQYINTVKTQVRYAKEIQSILANSAGAIQRPPET